MTLLTILISLIILFGHVDTNTQTKLTMLRERMNTLENRLSEDISFLRRELYSEISTLKDSESDPTAKQITENLGPDLEVTNQSEAIKEFEEEINLRLNVLQDGIRTEKVYRRDLQRQMSTEQMKSMDVVKALTDLEETVKTKLDLLNLSDHMSVLEEMKQLLEGLLSNTVKSQDGRASDCSDLLRKGHTTSDIYEIFPDTLWRPLNVYCDMTTDGGGWTVFQRRCNGSENFYRPWNDYRFGFGNLSAEFWLGNEFLYRLLQLAPHELRIELEDFDNDRRYGKYGIFEIKSVADLFEIHIEDFNGTVTDSLIATHDGQQFSTFDRGPASGCSKTYKGGFWYAKCHSVNINGEYLAGEHESYANGVNWRAFRGPHYSLKFTEMKFRPK